MKVLHISVRESVSEAIVGMVASREGVDVEPHAPDVVAEEVVVVSLAAGMDGAQVGHG